MHHTQIDSLACGDSILHRLDSRIKLLAVLAFTVCVISSGKTSISILFCYAIWPLSLLVVSRTPLKLVLKQVLVASGFIAVLAASNIFYNREMVTVAFGPFQWQMTEGVLICCSIIGKFIITISALTALAATTRFADILVALDKLKVPKLLIMQLSFLWRYIFMLIDRATHMLRAKAGREIGSIGYKNQIKTSAAMIGSLLSTSISTASRVNIAMQARGFDGRIRFFDSRGKRGKRVLWGFVKHDYIFGAVTILFLAAMVMLNSLMGK